MSKASTTSKPEETAFRTPDQEDKLQRLIEDAGKRGYTLVLKKVDPDRKGLQKLLETGDKFIAAVVDGILEKARKFSIPNRYAAEQVISNYGYLSGYKEPKSIAEQVAKLREFFPQLDDDIDVMAAEKPLPEHAEGYFAIPRWQAIAPTYCEAFEKVLALLKIAYKDNFVNYREGALREKYLKPTAKTAAMFERLYEAQSGKKIKPNFLAVAAQFGIRYRGRSVRRACEVMNASEFDLDPFTVGIMLLTHPERLQDPNDLWIDCSGAEYAPEANGLFSKTSFFFFCDDKLKFGTHNVGLATGNCGSASGFFPQLVIDAP